MSEMKLLAMRAMARLGEHLPAPFVQDLRRATSQIETGRWMKSRGFSLPKWSPSREALWELVADKIANERVLYLEFGVYQGNSIRKWAALLKNPESRLFGFDSFEGLPERWRSDHRTGTFDTGGAIPHVNDPRVQFIKGWFDQTLPTQQFPEHDRLVINIDCDLYSSTATVLKEVRPIIAVGTYIYFDELDDCAHEQLAFDEFLDDSGMEFELIGATSGFTNAMFQRANETARRPG